MRTPDMTPLTIDEMAKGHLGTITGKKARRDAYWGACMGVLAVMPERGSDIVSMLLMVGRFEEAFDVLTQPRP